MAPVQGAAWKYFDTVIKERNGNRSSCCRFCKKNFSGSHARHVAHFDPDDTGVGTCHMAPESVLTHVSAILKEKINKASAKKRAHDLAQLANADRTVRKQQKIDNICNAFSREEVDNKACRAWISVGIPFAAIENEDVTAWTKALRMASFSYKDPGQRRLSGSLLRTSTPARTTLA